MSLLPRVRRIALATAVAGLAASAAVSTSTPSPAAAGDTSSAGRPAVTESRVLGRSVESRAIRAYRVGDGGHAR
jgi:hypothetical protein